MYCCLFAVVMVGIIVFSGRDFGEMLDAEHRSATGEAPAGRGDSDAKRRRQPRRGAHRLAAAPVLRCADPLADGGRGRRRGLHGTWGSEPGASVFEIAGNAAFVDALLWGTFTMVAVALVMGVGSGIANLDEAMETVIDGFSMMLTALTILVMAWTIGSVTTALGTGIYVTNIAENFVTPTLLPVVVLVASAFIAFSTGTSWGTMAIVTPIAVPLAWSVGGATPALLPVAIGTVFSGAIFGDHCSPISDTTILSSTFTGADHIDHVRTQMYYATTVLVVAASLLTVWGATRITPLVLLPVGVVMLGGLVYVLSEFDANRKDVEATRTVRVGNRSATDDD